MSEYYENWDGEVKPRYKKKLELAGLHVALKKGPYAPVNQENFKDDMASQCIPDKAHHPWIIVKEDATVVAAHCTCMGR